MIGHFVYSLVSALANFDEGFETEELLEFAIGLFALLLFALTISTYRKTRLTRLLIVAIAFLLFAVEVVIKQLDEFVLAVGYQTDQTIAVGMEFIILLLFFIAVVVER